MTEPEYLQRLVKLMICLNVSLFSIDEVKGKLTNTNKLRNKINTAEKAIEERIQHFIKDMFDADDGTMREVLKEYENIALLLSKCNFEDLSVVHQGLVNYFEQKAVLYKDQS